MSKWKTVRLGDVCEIAAGQGAPQGDSNYCDEGTPFVKAGNLIELIEGKSEKQIQKVSEEVAKSHKLKKYKASSILFAKSGMSCMKGYVYQLKNDCYVVSHLAIVKPKEDFSDYIEYCLRHIKPNTLVKDEAYPSISLQDISNLQIPLPPLETQKQIAAVLDKCTSLISKYKQILKKYDTLIKSRFIEMFGENPVESGKWKVEKFKNICLLITDGEHTTPQRCTQGIYLLSARNVLNHKLQLDNVDYIDESEYQRIAKRIVPQENDILLSCSGSVGRVCVVPKGLKFQLVRSVALLRLKKDVNPIFMEHLITSDHIQTQIEKSKTQSSQANLFQGKIAELIGFLPPLYLQNDFSSFVQQVDKSKFENNYKELVA